jgi:hypothetical protein
MSTAKDFFTTLYLWLRKKLVLKIALVFIVGLAIRTLTHAANA